MTVTVSYSPLTYNCNGSTTAFSVTWPFFLSSDLVVTHITSGGVETTLALTTDYTVTGGRDSTTGLPAVGTVTTVATYAAGVKIRISRSTPKTQSTSFTTAGAFPAKTVEAMIDRVHMIAEEGITGVADDITGDVMQLNSSAAQDYWDGEGNPIRVPFVELTEASAPDTPSSGYGRIYTKTDGYLYHKNDAGTETDITSAASLAAASASAASTSASNASTSASAASTSASAASTSASAAATSATAASTSASNASTSASAASTSASNASTSASTASTHATNAASSASAASTSATNAATSATEAAASVGFVYTYSTTTTMADPGTGIVRFNSATLASVTAIAIDDLSADTGNPDVSNWILTFDNSTATNKGTLRFRKKSAPQNFVDYTVTALTDNAGWTELAVTHAASSGSLSNSDSLLMAFYATGDVGPAGPPGSGSGDVNGPASSVASEIALFDGTTGKLIKRASTTGIVKATSGVISAAVSGTDYAPATSGTSILKGSGTGGFSNATSGTDYAPATSGSSILKGNGAGGFSNAASGTDYAPATSGTAILKGNGSGGFSAASGGTDYANASHTHTQSDLTGLTTADSPQFTGINLGHATDTTLTRAAAGEMAVEGNQVPSPGSVAQGDVLYYNGSTWARLGAGTSGQFLKTNGAGANPAWADGGSTVGTPVTSGTIGYGAGTGGTVTQATSITTGVTLNKAAGAITLYSSSTLGTDSVTSFTLTNSTIEATDVVIVNWKTNVTHRASIYVSAITSGSCKINMVNHDASTSLNVSSYVLNFVVIKAATS